MATRDPTAAAGLLLSGGFSPHGQRFVVMTTCKRASQYSHGDSTFKTADAEWCQPVVLNLPNS